MNRISLWVLSTHLLGMLPGCMLWPLLTEEEEQSRYDVDGDGIRLDEGDCDDRDATVGLPVTWYQDADNDGFGGNATEEACPNQPPEGHVAVSGDCNDGNPEIHPEAVEVCNGIDDNCDELVDEDDPNAELTIWYRDADSDTYGTPEDSLAQCDQPTGYVASDEDCDDGDNSINPDGTEVCDDGIDQDCNGILDDAEEASLWFADTDGDGFGNADASIYSCEESVDGYVLNSDDCDDANIDVHPEANEACDDGIDNDCDGIIDSDAEDVTWYRDADEDGYGNADDTTIDCAPPSGYVGNDEDCDDGDTDVNPSVEEVCNNGVDDNCDESPNECLLSGELSLTSAHTTLEGEYDDDQVTKSIATCDLNGDALLDLVVTGYANATSGSDANVGWVHFGPLTSGVSSLATSDIIIQATEVSSTFSVACDDLTGDGVDDLILGAPKDEGGATQSGMLYLFEGPVTTGTYTVNDADYLVSGETPDEDFGYQVMIIDFDHDGQNDIATSARLSNSQHGGVYLFSGPITADRSASDADLFLSGEAAGDQAGYTMTTGDLDADGYADLIIGAPFNDNTENSAGAVYVFYTPISSSASSLGSGDMDCYGAAADDQFGSSVAVGDLNGDTLNELLIGAPQESEAASNAGAAYIIESTSGTCDLSTAIKMTGDSSSEYAGIAIDASGDIDKDGYTDLLVGAVTDSNNSLSQNGGTYVVYGPITSSTSFSSADVLLGGTNHSDQAGWVSQITKDLTGDDAPDLIISAINNDAGGTNAGAVYIVEGLGY